MINSQETYLTSQRSQALRYHGLFTILGNYHSCRKFCQDHGM